MPIAPVTTLGLFGVPDTFPAGGVVPVVGPNAVLNFTLALGGPLPNVLQPQVPQGCQNSDGNVLLKVLLVDEAGNPLDVSQASSVQFFLLAPNGGAVLVVGEFSDNGMDGLIEYQVQNTDLQQPGLWRIQAQLVYGARTIQSGWSEFEVFPNVPDF